MRRGERKSSVPARAGDEPLGWSSVLSRDQRLENRLSLFNNNRDDFAPRSAMILRGLLDEAGVPVSGGVEPPPERPTLF